MADILGIGNFVTGAVQAGANIGQGIYNNIQEVKNLDYIKALQKQTWAREDSAVQRRVADLKAAGLNPVLAAGQAATTMAPIKTEAPKMEGLSVQPIRQSVMDAMALMQARQNIENTAQENELIKLQQQEKKIDIQKKSLEVDYTSRVNPLNIQMITRDAQAYNELKRIEIATAASKEWIASHEAQIKQYEAEIMLALKDKGIQISQAEARSQAEKLAVLEKEYNLDRWKAMGLPTNAGLGDSWTRTFAAGQGILSDFAQRIFGGK